MLSQDRPGGDVQAMQQLLAANALAPDTAADGLLDAVLRRLTTAKIADARAGVLNVAVSPEGQRLASAAMTTRCGWDTDTGQPLGKPIKPSSPDERLLRLAFSPTELRVASRSADNTVRVLRRNRRARRRPAVLDGGHETGGCGVISDGHRLATVGDGRTVRVWNADTGEPVSTLHTGDMKPVGGVALVPTGIAWPPGAPTVIRCGTPTRATRSVPLCQATSGVCPLWCSAETGIAWPAAALIRRCGCGTPTTACPSRFQGPHQPGGQVAFSPDGHRLASGGTDNTVWVWNVDNGQPDGVPLTGHTDWVQSVAFRDDEIAWLRAAPTTRCGCGTSVNR